MRARAATIAAAMQLNFRQRHVPVSKSKRRRGKGGTVVLESDKSLRTLAATTLAVLALWRSELGKAESPASDPGLKMTAFHF